MEKENLCVALHSWSWKESCTFKNLSIYKKQQQNTNVSLCSRIIGEKGEWTDAAEEYGLFITSACSKLVCIPNVFIYSTQ